MKAAVLCFSLTGWQTGKRLCEGLRANGMAAELFTKSRYLPDSIEESAGEWAGERFADADALFFIGACGIAVRSIAPYVRSKQSDPAVLVIDECAQYVISLLSGHLGGANALAELSAKLLGAAPVVTTATDLHGRFAVDTFAKKNGCAIRNLPAAKEVSAALLAGKTVGFFSEFPYDGTLPEGLSERTDADIGIAVTIRKDCRPFPVTVQIIPPAVVLGIGCRRGKEPQKVKQAAADCLKKQGICREALAAIASIDLKKDERALQLLAKEWGVSFLTYTGEELRQAAGTFTPSAFVKEITGIDNVCERSAVLGSGSGVLLQKKTAADGVTTAAALKKWRACFE